MKVMSKLVIANWKLNPPSSAQAQRLFRGIAKTAKQLQRTKTVVCPPFVYLSNLSVFCFPLSSPLALGAQDVFWESSGAYTGEVSAPLLASSGARYVIVGHSERRLYFKETDEMIGRKVAATIEGGLIPVLCVGEWTRKGVSAKKIKNFVKQQLVAAFDPLLKLKPRKNVKLVVAYEPIWAISTMGSGEGPDTPENAVEMIEFIRKFLNAKPYTLNPRVIYGGSVNQKNAESFLRHPEIEGALVGGASLKANSFGKILKIAENIKN